MIRVGDEWVDRSCHVFDLFFCRMVGIYLSSKYEPNSLVDVQYKDVMVDCRKYIIKYVDSNSVAILSLLVGLYGKNETMSILWYATIERS